MAKVRPETPQIIEVIVDRVPPHLFREAFEVRSSRAEAVTTGASSAIRITPVPRGAEYYVGIVKRSDQGKGDFLDLSKHWVVERTILLLQAIPQKDEGLGEGAKLLRKGIAEMGTCSGDTQKMMPNRN